MFGSHRITPGDLGLVFGILGMGGLFLDLMLHAVWRIRNPRKTSGEEKLEAPRFLSKEYRDAQPKFDFSAVVAIANQADDRRWQEADSRVFERLRLKSLAG